MTSRSRKAAPLTLLLWALAALPGRGAEPASIGIDVSHHSGAIDWETVARHGFTFVYLKATEGVDDPDPMFEQHWQTLGELGIPRGAYHFYVTEDDPEQQAEFFLSQAKLGPGDLAPVVDVEVIGKGTSGNLSKQLLRFLEIVERRLGVTPIIYTGVKFWNAHFEPTFGKYPLWVAEYQVEEPSLPHGWSDWHLWQFEGDADIDGIEKGADRSRVRDGIDWSALRVTQTPGDSEM